MPNQSELQTLDQVQQDLADVSSRISDKTDELTEVNKNIQIDKNWFPGKCSFKNKDKKFYTGQRVDIPTSEFRFPATGGNDNCGWRKDRYLANLAKYKGLSEQIDRLNNEYDRLSKLEKQLLESEETQAGLSPEELERRSRERTEREERQQELKLQKEQLAYEKELQRQKTRKIITISAIVAGSLILIAILYFVGKKQGWI